MANYDADTIVIGSGSGGLTAALALANAGNRVMVLEQHYVPGGWCHNFSKEGFSFCPGVHYIGRLGKGGETRQMYEGLGVAKDLVFFEQNPDAYEHCHIAGTRFDYPSNLATMTERLQTQFPSQQRGIGNYMELLQHMIAELPLIFEINGIKDVLLMPYHTRHLGRFGLFSLKRTLEDRISDPVLRAILSVQCGDQGLPPSKTMMMLHAGLARHYEQGGFYPQGGGGAIARALVKGIKRQGGQVKLGAAVEKILIERQGSSRQVLGVRLANGKELRCRQVISNADPHRTFVGMIGDELLSDKLRKRLGRTRYSVSSLSLFLAVDIDPRRLGLDSGNIWLSRLSDFDEVFRRAYDEHLYENEAFDAVFISAPTLKDPTSYNGRGHTLEVVTFVGYQAFKKFEHSVTEQRPEAYQKLKQKIITMFMTTLKDVIPDLEKHVIFCDVGTPVTNTHYLHASEGAVYGTEKNYRQIGPMAYRAKTEIKGLLLAGASTSAHGVSGAASSGLYAAAAVMNCTSKELLKDTGQTLRTYSAEDSRDWPAEMVEKIAARKARFSTP